MVLGPGGVLGLWMHPGSEVLCLDATPGRTRGCCGAWRQGRPCEQKCSAQPVPLVKRKKPVIRKLLIE